MTCYLVFCVAYSNCIYIFFQCRFVYVPPHTKEVLSNMLMDLFLDWNMYRKVTTITVDNCSSNDGMIDILKEKFYKVLTRILQLF